MATADPAQTPERMRIVASLRGNTIALVQPGFVLVLELPNLEPVAELGIPGDIDDNDVAYIADSGHLAVLSRSARSSTLHVVDPAGPTKLGEVEFRAPARIAALAGERILVAAANALSIVDVGADKLAAVPLPVRGNVTVAGGLGAERWVLAVGGALEEWDAIKRAPGRRLRLDQALDPLFVGGNAQQIWTIPKKQPDVVDVISLAARSTRRIELPEPVAVATQHPSGLLLAVIGAATRDAYVIDLTRSKSVARVDGGAMTDVTWLGRAPTLVIKPVNAPIELVMISLPGDTQHETRETAAPAPVRDPEDVVVQPPPPTPEVPPTQWSREDIASRLAAWREKNAGKAAWSDDALRELDPANPMSSDPPSEVRDDEPSDNVLTRPEQPAPPDDVGLDDLPAPAIGAEPRTTESFGGWRASALLAPAVSAIVDDDLVPRIVETGGWRAELARWARASGTHRTRPPDDGLAALAARLGFPQPVRHAIALLYGAYLGGVRISAVDLADALGWDWTEALGNGALAVTELVRWRDRDIRLCRELIAALDERPPLHGTIVPGPASSDSVAIVAPREVDVARVGRWAAPTVGALLVPGERAQRKPRAFVREARVRALAPLVPWSELAAALGVPPRPAVIVVDDDAIAASLQLPVAATWPG